MINTHDLSLPLILSLFSKASSGLMTSRNKLVATWAYKAVVPNLACPSNTCITRISTWASSKCVAKLCLLCRARHRRHYVPFLTMSC